MKIEHYNGVDDELFLKVARLVMNPDVLRENNNYPFKTSERFIWFVASEEEQVIGFMPVELKKNSMLVNNYYVSKGNSDVLDALLKAVIQSNEADENLQAVVLSRDIAIFQMNNFDVIREWKLYVKMKWHSQQ
mgnify:CR=1 FL=1